MMKRDVEQELKDNLDVCRQIAKSETFAQHVYAALCNHQFYPHNIDRLTYEPWSCSWRYAGGMIAEIRNTINHTHETYIDWYCSGIIGEISYIPEGFVTPDVNDVFDSMGWDIVEYDGPLEIS